MKCIENRKPARRLLRAAAFLAITCLPASNLQSFPPPADAKQSADAKDPSGPAPLPRIDLSITDNRQYLIRLKYVLDQEARYLASEASKGDYRQDRGRLECYLGWYKEALVDSDRATDWQPQAPDLEPLQGFESQDAIEAVLQLADKHQVIMINEAHHVPLHRAFAIQLLAGLYRKGFRYLAAESLSPADTKLEECGYLKLEPREDIPEPFFAELVRTALRLGYHVVPFEIEKSQRKVGKPGLPIGAPQWVEFQNEREEVQARNIKERILAKDPAAKILVYAGYNHIAKRAWPFGNDATKASQNMASAFKSLTGIDPLSVDQTMMMEHDISTVESPNYKLAIQLGLVKERPVVLRERTTNAYFVPAIRRDSYDLVVMHPRTRYENGRPTWMALGGTRQPHALRDADRPPKGSFYLAQAFYPGEDAEKAVPADQIAYGADSPVPTLWLPAGEFRVRIINDAGKTVRDLSSAKK